MNTPVSNRPLLTAFRTNYRPKLAKTQHELSSFLISPGVSTHQALSDSSSIRGSSDKSARSLSMLDRSGWSYRVAHALDIIIRDHNTYQQAASISGQIYRMFDATLSTVVLMASGETNIPGEHLVWSEAFLRGIRDRYGNHPPNVRKLLGFIKHIQTSQGQATSDMCDLFERTYRDTVPQNVTLTRIHPPTTV
ncbi:uncharacterized protein LOC129765012 [Toxorhynchites rutilus septentrionalis]|uniref:uncharacterized protein LOC129765012 n=1 Tax=Toxorhynchites rutilus septentrionalis TaxID=329112 RepID=UPI002478A3AE|nr:uncharacterized protein LOC129765012 [Toxorhynchites rutilus septentrionalis]